MKGILDSDAEPIWEQIRLLRKRRKITQQELAEQVQCTRQEISKIENGHFRGSVKKVERVVNYLGFELMIGREHSVAEHEQRDLPPPVQILAIDDDPSILLGYKQLFSSDESSGMYSLLNLLEQSSGEGTVQQRYELTTATSGEAGYELIKQSLDELGNSGYQLLLLDMRMLGGWDGLQTAREVRKIAPDIKIIIVSAYQDYSLIRMRESIGDDFIFQSKPYSQEQLMQLTNYMIRH